MAIVTRSIGTAFEAEGTAELQIDYDDTDLRVRVVRIVNTHPALSARVTARRNDGTGPVRTLDGPPNQTTEQAISTSPSQRLQLVVDAQGRLDGAEYSFAWVVL
jgi:hypothetical protein